MASHKAPDALNIAASFMPGLAIVGLAAAAAAFYMGWSYERNYVREWGLDFSAFSYSPYDLMVSSSATLLWAFGFPLGWFAGGVLAHLLPAGKSRSKSKGEADDGTDLGSFWNLVPIVAISVASLAFAFLLRDYKLAVWMFLVYLFLWAGDLWEAVRMGSSKDLRVFAGVIAIIAAIVVVYAPWIIAVDVARDDRRDASRLPAVQIVVRDGQGMPTEQQQGIAVAGETWRVVRHNNGYIWLAPNENNPGWVINVRLADIASILYLIDEVPVDPHSSPMPSPTRTSSSGLNPR